MKRTVLTFGLLSGLIIVAYTLTVLMLYPDFTKMSAADLSQVEVLGYLRYVILFLTVLFAIRQYRKSGGSGFGPLFRAGLYTSLVVAFLVGLMEMTYILLNPGFFEQYSGAYARTMQERGASAAEIARLQKQLDDFSWMKNPVILFCFYFLETAVLGTIFSLIIAALSKKRRQTTDGRPQVV